MSVDDHDLDVLTGIRSGKPSFYLEYQASAERLRRVIHALDRISRALVRTIEGPSALVRGVAEAAAEHLTAHWVVFALADGALPEARPRHLVLGPSMTEVPLSGTDWPGPDDLEAVPPWVAAHLRAVREGRHVDGTGHAHDHGPYRGPHAEPGSLSHDPHHLHVPIRLDGAVVGEIVAWTGQDRTIDATDASVLRVLASQTAAALQNSALHQRAVRLYDEASRHADDLAARNEQLQRTRDALSVARQREVLDSERHRIARELHDSVTQYALSAGMQIEVVRAEIDDPGQRERLETAKELTRRAVEQLRSSIYALHHGDDDAGHRTLPAMLEELSSVHMPSDLRVQVRIEGRPVALPSSAERSLLRVAGEALFNAAVHGDARTAVVRLAFRRERLTLSITDDGLGEAEQVRRSLRVAAAGDLDGSHRGLANMAERAREIGGNLEIRRARGGGIRVQVAVPLPIDPCPSPHRSGSRAS